MFETHIKVLMGEYAYNIAALQYQLDKANQRIKELESVSEGKERGTVEEPTN